VVAGDEQTPHGAVLGLHPSHEQPDTPKASRCNGRCHEQRPDTAELEAVVDGDC
jgi:hypothetical protein